MTLDIALVTYSELPGLAADELLLVDALSRLGLKSGPIVWDDPSVDWARIGVCVIRSTWDYHHRLDEFLAWAERVAAVTSLWNPAEVVRWNARKTYLRDLAAKGVSIVSTVWLERGSHADLSGIMLAQGWESGVVKPVVSASAYGTVLVTSESLGEGQAQLNKLLAERDVMVQPFMPSVETYGEHSLMFIDGQFTHSVRRVPAVGKDQSGQGKARRVEPPRNAIDFAASVLEAVDYPTLYARVDLVRDEEGELCLMELELIEPSLFLEQAPQVVERLAEAIAARFLQLSPART
jgi:hypothetical protein